MRWVSVEEVKENLRYDHDCDDMVLEQFILSAEASIKNYVTDDIDQNIAKTATMLMVGFLDENRNIDKDTLQDGNYLPAPIRSLLFPYRKPTAI